MALKAIIITDTEQLENYFNQFILNKMEIFSNFIVVCVGSGYLNETEIGNRRDLHFPYPNGVTGIDQLDQSGKKEYANRLVDLLTIEVEDDLEDVVCFFTNFSHAFLFPPLKERAQFRVYFYFNEEILSLRLIYKQEDEVTMLKHCLQFSETNIFSTSEVGEFLKESFNLPDDKFICWEYSTSNNLQKSGSQSDFERICLNTFRFSKIITFYGNMESTSSLSMLVNVISGLHLANPQIRIFLLGKISFDFIANNLTEGAKLAVTFLGRINESDLQKISAISICTVHVGESVIADNSFLYILNNRQHLISEKNSIPSEYRDHKYFHPVTYSPDDVALNTKLLLQNITEWLNDISKNDLYIEDFTQPDLRVPALKDILLPR
jgi:hypothetical protein